MKKAIILACSIVTIFIFTGCASMLSGNQTATTIKTDVPTQIKIIDHNGKVIRLGKSPLQVSLATGVAHKHSDRHGQHPAEYSIIIQEIENMKNEQIFQIKANINPRIWWNFIFILPIGFSVDKKSGAAYCFEENYYFNMK